MSVIAIFLYFFKIWPRWNICTYKLELSDITSLHRSWKPKQGSQHQAALATAASSSSELKPHSIFSMSFTQQLQQRFTVLSSVCLISPIKESEKQHKKTPKTNKIKHTLTYAVISVVFQTLIHEQQGQLSQYESAAGQCVGELQKAQGQVGSLQAKIRQSEARNQVKPCLPSLPPPDQHCSPTALRHSSMCVFACMYRSCRSVLLTWSWSCEQPRRKPSDRSETSRISPTASTPRKNRYRQTDKETASRGKTAIRAATNSITIFRIFFFTIIIFFVYKC